MSKTKSAQQNPVNMEGVLRAKINNWILELRDPGKREMAILQLCKHREGVPDFPQLLWQNTETVAALLQEITNVYSAMIPPTLTAHQSIRVCNTLALLYCVASQPEMRSAFVQSNVLLFLYPFLCTMPKKQSFEYLRLITLCVIGTLVKDDDEEVITYLVTTEFVPMCLRIMSKGTEWSKTISTFIMQKILLDDTGLFFVCHKSETLIYVLIVLHKVVFFMENEPSGRLLKYVLRCYLRLCENSKVRKALKHCLPDQLRDPTFASYFKEGSLTRLLMNQLLEILEPDYVQYPPPW